MKLEHAEPIANRILVELMDFCDKIEIAGSIRRKREEVKDIEIVCVPKNKIVTDKFLFPSEERDRGFIKQVYHLGRLVKGNPISGKYIQIIAREEIKIDLFITNKEDYYRILAIRTGPAEYSHRVIARSWSKKGWVGTDKGLRLIKEVENNNKQQKFTLPPVWKSERDFFEWVGIEYQDPSDRF